MKDLIHLFQLLALGCLLGACASSPPKPVELQPNAYRGPVVDIHTHTFNAKYLPIKGIVLGKRDLHPLAVVFSDGFVCKLADSLIAETSLPGSDEIEGTPVPACHIAGDCWQNSIPGIRQLNQFLASVILSAAGKCDPNEMGESQDRTRIGPVESIAISRSQFLGHKGSARSGAKFFGHLKASDADKDRHHAKTYGNRVAFHASHMMDLAPVYAQHEDGYSLIPFETAQIDRAQRFQNVRGANHVYFVAYNPFRDYWPTESPGKSLEIVKNAIEKRHAYGIKVYPPSGYRPAGNKIPRRPYSIFTPSPRRQWDARYACTSNGKLDRQLDELLSWCEREQIPIFAHCGVHEVEARNGYGEKMADPKYWAMALKKYPNLRLCFGHAGGEAHWFGHGKKRHIRWGQEVANLCRSYPNVYCEFGAQSEILEAEALGHFVETMRIEISKSGRYNFAGKIMFGTDFFMPSSLSGEDYLDSYCNAFADSRLSDFAGQFFFANAIRYLDVKRRVSDANLSSVVRQRLIELLNM